jgi:heme exporter protein C
VAALALAAHQALVWLYAPVEQTMGLIQKIFYLHLPMAWWALLSFFVVFVASVGYLTTRRPGWDRLAGAAAETGVLLSALALITGSLWARVSWNTWWTWDPRLTTTLVMWFIYAAYLVVRSMGLPRPRRAMVCAVIGVVAFLDVPLVFYSARLWRSIHPAVFASRGGGLEPEMVHTVLAGLAAWAFLWLALVWLRTTHLTMQDRLEATLTLEEL